MPEITSALAVVELPQARNCFRCGAEFRCDGHERLCPGCRRPKTEKRPLNPALSFRERQVVGLVSQGKPNKEIAFGLHLSEGTIKEYLNRIFQKVRVTNRTELAIWALTGGDIDRTAPATTVKADPSALIAPLRPARRLHSNRTIARHSRS